MAYTEDKSELQEPVHSFCLSHKPRTHCCWLTVMLPFLVVLSADLQLNPVKALVSNVDSVSCGVDFTVWLTKEGEVCASVGLRRKCGFV